MQCYCGVKLSGSRDRGGMVKRAASGRAAPCQRREAAMSEAEEMDEEVAIATLPLDAWHRAKNARMVEFAGSYMPTQYEGILAEHLWTRTSDRKSTSLNSSPSCAPRMQSS